MLHINKPVAIYTIAWRTPDNEERKVSVALDAVLILADVLENLSLPFMVSDEYGQLTQENFICSKYNFWMPQENVLS